MPRIATQSEQQWIPGIPEPEFMSVRLQWQQWRFEPGAKDGKPVRVIATIEVNFRLR